MYRSVPTMSPVCVRSSRSVRFGQAEVGDPDVALRVEQQVRRLDVAVQDALVMGVLQGVGHLIADCGDLLPIASHWPHADRLWQERGRAWRPILQSPGGRREWRRPITDSWSGTRYAIGIDQLRATETADHAAGPRAELVIAVGVACRLPLLECRQHVVERLPFDELHGVVEQPVALEQTEHRHNVGVVQTGGSLGLGAEPGVPLRIKQRNGGEGLRGPRDDRAIPDEPRSTMPMPPRLTSPRMR